MAFHLSKQNILIGSRSRKVRKRKAKNIMLQDLFIADLIAGITVCNEFDMDVLCACIESQINDKKNIRTHAFF